MSIIQVGEGPRDLLLGLELRDPRSSDRVMGDFTWCIEERAYMNMIKMASIKSRRKEMISLRLPVRGSKKGVKASWHLAEAGHIPTLWSPDVQMEKDVFWLVCTSKPPCGQIY